MNNSIAIVIISKSSTVIAAGEILQINEVVAQRLTPKHLKQVFVKCATRKIAATCTFVNSKRGKEISLRKIVGAGKAGLFMQFLSESLLTFCIALVLATGIIYLVMPFYNSISGKNIVFKPGSADVLAVYGITMLATLLPAGIYPAVTLSSFKPLEAMKGKLSGIGGKGSFRKVLVVVQFSFSIMLITSTIIISKQLKYIREKNLGYKKENAFTFRMRNINNHYDAAVAELLKQPGILGVTESGADVINNSSGSTDIDWDGKRTDQQSFGIFGMAVERNFLQVMGMQLVEGNGFTGTAADSSNFILNETDVKAAGIKEPAVTQRLTFQGMKGGDRGCGRRLSLPKHA